MQDLSPTGDISVAELGFHSPIGTAEIDPLDITQSPTAVTPTTEPIPFETKEFPMSTLFDDNGLPIMFN